MDVFGKGTDEPSRPLLPPGMCWICDSSPTQEAEKVIDTRRNARPGGPTVHESVRKYICEGCARDMGKAMGMVDGEKYADAVAEVGALERALLDARAKLVEALDSQMRVVSADELTAKLLAAIKPTAPAKKARVPASDE